MASESEKARDSYLHETSVLWPDYRLAATPRVFCDRWDASRC
jgi:hypothetical protein